MDHSSVDQLGHLLVVPQTSVQHRIHEWWTGEWPFGLAVSVQNGGPCHSGPPPTETSPVVDHPPGGPLCIPIPNMLSHVKIPMQVEIFFTFHDRAAHDASVHPLAQVSQKPVVMPLAREEHGCIVYPSLCYKSSSVTMHCSACLIRCFADFASKETTQSHERRHAKTQFRYASSGPPMCS